MECIEELDNIFIDVLKSKIITKPYFLYTYIYFLSTVYGKPREGYMMALKGISSLNQKFVKNEKK